ncbi:protein NUCLEAR FUSION DEFECTIVE 4-like [Carica papaya]|uniref:protein NUCLEAR FUSION DEFECTIVE 4-like n=1 Tax=Carica papaya TaxID=3649 RepID=UPI000B8C8AC1|nr:protein NUCLEAR FUSION DEFECTIVE 4-like [Carica papaya]
MEKLNTKWIATVASIWIQCTAGSSYTFAIYSPTLKSSQSYDQSTLDTVSVFKDIGANAGIFSGILYSAVSHSRHRHRLLQGPWVVHAAGAIQCFVGYFLMWASVVGLIHRPPVPLMCFFLFLAAHAQTFFNTANVVSGVQNFTDYGGTIVGIMKGFLGLSGAILIQLYDTVCKGNPTAYILVLAVTPTLVSLLLMHFVRIYGRSSIHEKKHLDGFSAVALSVAAYLLVIILLQNILGLPQWVQTVVFIFLLLLLAAPLTLAIKADSDDTERYSRTISPVRTPLMDNPEPTVSSKFSAGEDKGEYHKVPGDAKDAAAWDGDMNLLQAICTVNFWLLFIAMICGMGSGLATINNISQVGESLHYTTTEINSLVSLWSIWNFLGRFGAGYLSDIFLHRRGWGRPLFMVITLAMMTIGHVVIASGFPGNLYAGSIIVGVCYGSQWSLMPSITSEIFGVGHLGTIFNTISVASPIGSYIFSVWVIGFIYDKVSSDDNNSCYGTHCFALSFLIMASVAFFGFLIALALFFRTRQFYGQVVLRRLRHF